MNIVYASNDNYARHLGVSIYSLLERNAQMEEIVIYILSVSLSTQSKEKLQHITAKFFRQIVFIDLDNLEHLFDYQIDTGGFDISTMSRLFIGDLLPSSVDRVIYLDCDTVILRSMKRMWETDLKGNVIGAVMEPTIYTAVKKEIGLGNRDPYFNAGVLVIDLQLWRKNRIQQCILDFYREKDGHLFACDQDAINGALKGKIRPMLPIYNFFTNYRYFSYEELVLLSPVYRIISKEQFLTAKKRPVILHFMGDERPWFAGNLNHYRRAYDYFLHQTPWQGAAKETGKEGYMLIYHLMNYLTAVCPQARRQISKKFGMKTIASRQKG